MGASEPKLLRRALVYTAYEYVLIVLPVAMYIFLAAVGQAKPHHGFGDSPEWNIATIFLVAQAQSLYRLHIEASGKRLSHPALGLIALLSLLLIVFAATNIQLTLRHGSLMALVCMWTLLGVSSAIFIGFVTGARLLSLRRRAASDE